jgi:hypothetical protein
MIAIAASAQIAFFNLNTQSLGWGNTFLSIFLIKEILTIG